MAFQEEDCSSRLCPWHSLRLEGRVRQQDWKKLWEKRPKGEKIAEKIERKRERGKNKSGLFIFWIDRLDGMEPCVRMKAAALLARTFFAHAGTWAHTCSQSPHVQYTCTQTHIHTDTLIFMGRWAFALALALCCRPGRAQTLISPSCFLSRALAKGAVFSRPARHGAIWAAQSLGIATDYLLCLPASVMRVCVHMC